MSELSPEEIQDLEALADALDNGIYYDLFKVDDDATGTQIKRAFYDLSRRYHPDRFYRRQLGDYTLVIERVFTGITLAYETLRNPLDRSRYDREVVAKHRRRQKRREDHETIPATPAVGEKAPDHETKFNLPRGRRRSASSAEGSDPGETEEAPRGGEQGKPLGAAPRRQGTSHRRARPRVRAQTTNK